MNNLAQQLKKVEQLAFSGRWARLLHNPVRYISTLVYTKFVYPRTLKGRLKKATTFFGKEMQVLLPSATDIYLTGGKTHDSEIRLAKFMINEVTPGDVIVDVGAHYGYYTLLASELTGSAGMVYAFDAASNTFSILQNNVAQAANIHVVHNAVSDKEENVSFYEFPVLYSEYNTMNVEQFHGSDWIHTYKPEKVTIAAVTLDGFINSVNKAPQFIKIDAEGAEDKVIEGSKNTLHTYAPVVVVEVLSVGRLNEPHMKAVDMLKEWGYASHIINNDGVLETVDDVNGYFGKNKIESDNIVFIKNNK